MVSIIIGIVISLGLIIAGISGEYVLKGTDSSVALIIAGCIFLVYEIYKIVKYKKG